MGNETDFLAGFSHCAGNEDRQQGDILLISDDGMPDARRCGERISRPKEDLPPIEDHLSLPREDGVPLPLILVEMIGNLTTLLNPDKVRCECASRIRP